ncbi:MAG: methenyltetrahydromethanopterin cyclohydrolase [Candidatus Bathyarchaeota archaeon]|nr:methenyltetrahydromethanopterin cyclohydrolase [Candidatus Bathyarchaeota archaeon]
MSKPEINLNLSALSLVKQICKEATKYGVIVEKTTSGATIVDAGIKAKGGFLAGKMVTEICLGGYGQAKILPAQYDDVVLPSIYVHTDYPAIATLASQFAGWRIKVNEYSAIGSGPARALALKPKKLYKKVMYEEKSEVAVLVLETNKKPPEEAIEKISDQCAVNPENLFLVLISTSCLAGSTQVSGRIVETGLHKLEKIGLNPNLVQYAWGHAPIIPLHPKFDEAMGRTNDAILYGGTAYYIVDYDNDDELEKLVRLAPSSASKMIQEAKALAKKSPSFLEIFKEAGFDFYEVDSNVFAPAIVVVNNMRTGKIFRAGSLDIVTLKGSFGL